MLSSKKVNLRRLFSRENPDVLSGFIANAEEDAGRRTTVTPDDIIAAVESAVSEIEVSNLSKRRQRAKKFLTLRIPGCDAGLRAEVMIDQGLWFVMTAAVIIGNDAAA